MNSSEPIGGFLELELRKGNFPHDNAILLNSGRTCFEYLLLASQAKHVYLAKYTCDAMIEPLKKLGIEHSFYRVNADLEIADAVDLKEGEIIVYNNYFGIKDKYSLSLVEVYGSKLVLDCAQAFYFEPGPDVAAFYSFRKFFGVPDGGALAGPYQSVDDLPQDLSYGKAEHLLRRLDEGPDAAYDSFKRHEETFAGQAIAYTSRLTKSLMGNTDHEGARKTRNENFAYLHDKLSVSNKLQIDTDNINGPLCYPYMIDSEEIRQKLIDNKIYVPTYWPNVMEWSGEDEVEHGLAKNILPMPVDQRYSLDDMDRILGLLND